MTLRKSWLWLLFVIALVACSSRELATGEAKQYAADMGYEVLGISCTDIDSDGDGYVTCSVRVKGDTQPLDLQCAAKATLNTGCKPTQPKLVNKTSIHSH